MPFMEGKWTELYRYAVDHMIHPDDRGAYSALMDPDKLQSRMESARDGVRSAEFRFRTTDGGWIWTRQVMIAGPRSGLRDGIVWCYIYDISMRKQREQGRISFVAKVYSQA